MTRPTIRPAIPRTVLVLPPSTRVARWRDAAVVSELAVR